MDKKNITPNPQQPVDRQPAGKLPNLLVELEEASLSSGELALSQPSSQPSGRLSNGSRMPGYCSYDGDEE